ncbi:AI-2E family transporter [Candidatus Uhrbacteria bacterium]|nr:AI-2E family transporter [Candidatus Uhrbacteria bacterium]
MGAISKTPNHLIQTRFFFLLFGTVALAAVLLIVPFYKGLILATTLAVVFYPLYNFLLKRLGGIRWISATVTIILAVIVVLTPLAFIGYQLISESRDLYLSLSNGGGGGEIIQMAEEPIKRLFPSFELNIEELLRNGANYIGSKVADIFTSTLSTVLNISLGLLAFYFFLVEGPKLRDRLLALSPLPDSFDERILNRVSETMQSVMKGSLLIAVIQGTLTAIGFWLFGVPNPVFWGSVTAIGALIPGVGTSMTIIPAVIYLYFTGDLWQPIALTIWGVTAVGLIDNALAPYLIGSGVKIHPFIILLSVLGGIGLFGPLGFLIGPIVAALFFTLLDVYQQMIVEKRRVMR